MSEIDAREYPKMLTTRQKRRRRHQCGLCDGEGYYVTEAGGEQRCIRCRGYGRVAEPQGGEHGD